MLGIKPAGTRLECVNRINSADEWDDGVQVRTKAELKQSTE
jgi:hypothetical protein